jgi:hypothetical protein
MSSRILLLAHGPRAEAHARRVASELNALGFAVGAHAGGTRPRLDAAHRVVLLWSRATARTPALRAAARAAKAAGKLVCVRLDAARPPSDVGGAGAIAVPRGRAQRSAWRRMLGPTPSRRPARQEVKPAPSMRPTRTPRRRDAAPLRVAASAPAPAPVRSRSTARVFASLAALGLIALALGAEAYIRDAAFATRVNALAGLVQAQAAEIVADIAARVQRGG